MVRTLGAFNAHLRHEVALDGLTGPGVHAPGPSTLEGEWRTPESKLTGARTRPGCSSVPVAAQAGVREPVSGLTLQRAGNRTS
jgi:hypothetical protein